MERGILTNPFFRAAAIAVLALLAYLPDESGADDANEAATEIHDQFAAQTDDPTWRPVAISGRQSQCVRKSKGVTAWSGSPDWLMPERCW